MRRPKHRERVHHARYKTRAMPLLKTRPHALSHTRTRDTHTHTHTHTRITHTHHPFSDSPHDPRLARYPATVLKRGCVELRNLLCVAGEGSRKSAAGSNTTQHNTQLPQSATPAGWPSRRRRSRWASASLVARARPFAARARWLMCVAVTGPLPRQGVEPKDTALTSCTNASSKSAARPMVSGAPRALQSHPAPGCSAVTL